MRVCCGRRPDSQGRPRGPAAIAGAVLVGLAILLPVAAGHATAQEDPVQNIIRDVVLPALESMDRTVHNNSGAAIADRVYGPVPSGVSPKARRELRRLQVEHDCKVAKLEIDLQERIDKAQEEFERDAAKERRPRKLAEKRDRLAEKVDEAYEKFEKKVADANESYREKRRKILRERRG
jgi:hypothetical protein